MCNILKVFVKKLMEVRWLELSVRERRLEKLMSVCGEVLFALLPNV